MVLLLHFGYLQQLPLQQLWPHRFSFAVDKDISVQSVVNTGDASILFHLPLSIQAYGQYQDHLQVFNSLIELGLIKMLISGPINRLTLASALPMPARYGLATLIFLLVLNGYWNHAVSRSTKFSYAFF